MVSYLETALSAKIEFSHRFLDELVREAVTELVQRLAKFMLRTVGIKEDNG